MEDRQVQGQEHGHQDREGDPVPEMNFGHDAPSYGLSPKGKRGQSPFVRSTLSGRSGKWGLSFFPI